MIDGHIHLDRGPLTKEYLDEFVNEAINKGIDEIHVLNHTHRFKEFLPIYLKEKNIPAQKEWLDGTLDDSIYDYIEFIKEMKKIDFPIKIEFGLEVCYAKEYEEFLREILSIYKWDFIIGSVHFVDHIAYDCDWSVDELWSKYPVDEIYKHYYESVLDLTSSGLFSQVGHPDTIKMFNYYPNYDLTDTYHKLAESIYNHHLKVENNVGIYFRHHHKDMGLTDELLKIFKDHKCEMITVSDAHCPKDVGTCIKDIWDKTMN